jgi:hypothetical protein
MFSNNWLLKTSEEYVVRKIIDKQIKIGEVDISEITFNTKSRDEMVKTLKGLQHLYIHEEIRTQLFDFLEQLVPEGISTRTGRPGMELWKVFVLAMIRLAKNCDLDGLLDIADHHFKVREMMGHLREDNTKYDVETMRRNMQLFTPKVLEEINKIVVDAGHKIVVKKNGKMNMKYW